MLTTQRRIVAGSLVALGLILTVVLSLRPTDLSPEMARAATHAAYLEATANALLVSQQGTAQAALAGTAAAEAAEGATVLQAQAAALQAHAYQIQVQATLLTQYAATRAARTPDVRATAQTLLTAVAKTPTPKSK